MPTHSAPSRRWFAIAWVVLALAACSDSSRVTSPGAGSAVPGPGSAIPVARVDASDLLAKFECNRCHEGAGMPIAHEDKQCVGCHRRIQTGQFTAEVSTLARWRHVITSMRWAPSLDDTRRLKRTWVRDFLLAPHDVRPGLVGQMPRLALGLADAERLAAHLVPTLPAPRPPAPKPDDLANGAALFMRYACASCHRFEGASVDDPARHQAGGKATADDALRSWALAPDLRHTRSRMDRAAIEAWIFDPRGAMPRLGVTHDEARQLAALIEGTVLSSGTPAATAPVTRLPVLERRVTWDEVAAKVFHTVCWHCHAAPHQSRGDGGPGMTGGFGFAPRGLDLSSYASISSGSLDDAGQPRSIFAKLPDGTPRLVAHLMARHAEVAGSPVEGVRGMPLGLPPLTLEQIQLVDTWIAQGRPQ